MFTALTRALQNDTISAIAQSAGKHSHVRYIGEIFTHLEAGIQHDWANINCWPVCREILFLCFTPSRHHSVARSCKVGEKLLKEKERLRHLKEMVDFRKRELSLSLNTSDELRSDPRLMSYLLTML